MAALVRNLMLTSDGYIGLVPGGTKNGERIGVLLSSGAPVS